MPESLDNLPRLEHFLRNQPAATVAVPIDSLGTIHSASLLYWHDSRPLRFYFVTSKESEKCRLLSRQDSVPAACVVGTTRGVDFTLQMRGTMQIVNKEQFAEVLEQYYVKRGDSHDDIIDPVNVLIEFVPNWARYTDYSKGYEKHVLRLGDGGDV